MSRMTYAGLGPEHEAEDRSCTLPPPSNGGDMSTFKQVESLFLAGLTAALDTGKPQDVFVPPDVLQRLKPVTVSDVLQGPRLTVLAFDKRIRQVRNHGIVSGLNKYTVEVRST